MKCKILFVSASSLVLIGLCSLLLSCSPERSKHQTEQNENLAVSDTCNFCNLDSFLIKPMPSALNVRLIIDKPIAIKFFNRFNLMQKYHNENSYDTLMKVFKMKHPGDRNVIYALTEQYYYFDNEIKPILIDNSIGIIDTVGTTPMAEFRGTKKTFVINLLDYKDQDGVLMFNPDREPIFWTFEKEQIYCKDLFGMVKQYFVCSVSGGSE
jgi:hypothetical protein